MGPLEPSETVDVPKVGTLPVRLSGFQRDMLTEIIRLNVHCGARPHGTPLKRRLARAYGKEIPTGRLYPNLDELADLGYLEIKPKNGRANAYLPTRDGRRVLREIVLAIMTALPPEDVEGLLDELESAAGVG